MEEALFRFQHPELLPGLALVPLLLALFMLSRWTRRHNIRKFGDPRLVNGLMPEASAVRPVWKYFIALAAWASVVLALARPQFGSRLEEVKRRGVEVIIALDVSNSMLAQDIQPSRLEAAKQAISRMVDRLQDDKTGLVVFAGDAYVQVPITNDYVSVKMLLASVSPESVPRQGTAIGSAIDLAANSFSPASEAGKAIVVITDGENHEDDPAEAARKANEKGIVVHALGVGLPQGAPVPMNPSADRKNFRRDREGNVVISKLDEQTLSQVAMAGHGKYVRASNSRFGLNIILDEINSMEKVEQETRIFSEYDERFRYLAALALLLLLLEFIVLERKNKWVSKINLFGKSWQERVNTDG